jgi:hypothetical protein
MTPNLSALPHPVGAGQGCTSFVRPTYGVGDWPGGRAGSTGCNAWITRAVLIRRCQYATSASVFRTIYRNTACASIGDN